MKKIFLHCFFLSWIFTLQAQITPDGGTNTQVNSQNGVELIDIAAPNTSGLSNNSYSEFNVSSSGIILNNSGGTSASQLTGGNISGNSNITAGNQASLILNQITGNNTSLLEGKTEVVGTKAEVIIANPNGITCSGCGFINASQLSLITGTSQWDSSNNLTHFNIDNNGKIIVNGTGLDAEEVDVLNLVSRYHEITAEIKAKDKLRILAGNHNYNLQNFTLDSSTGIENNSGNLSIDISALGGLKAGSIELVSSEENLNVNYTANTTANNLNITVTGDLSFNTDFQNNGNINATILNFQVGGDFSYDDANNDFVLNASDNLVVLGSASITANNYSQSGTIDIAGDLSIQVTSKARLDDTASIKAKNLLFSAYDFYNQADFTITDSATFDIGNDFWNGFRLSGTDYDGGNISADNFNVTAGDRFYNWNGTINADNFNVTAYNFSNSYNATISADNFNVTTGYGFSNSATINANNFNVTADDFNNGSASATINANNFNVTAYSFSNSRSTINANNFNVTADDFYNLHNATINADNFNVTVGDDFFNYNKATINANNFNVTTDDFYNRDNATISADSLNISYNRLHNTDIIIGSNASYFGSIFIENVNTLPIVPDGASSTDAIQSSSGIDVINIARPDGNGISNNSYSDFNVLSSGLVFNNSASAVSSSLAGTIAGNPNYAASDSASLILNQITSNNASNLGGMLEVAGNSAAIIIANPNGIVCDGCSFANTDKVDLITAGNDVFIYNANIVLREFNVTAGDTSFIK